MDELINKVKGLRSDIDNLPEVKEYYRLAKLYESDEELRRLRKEIARLASLKKFEERDALLKIYNEHPLVSNYTSAKEEIAILLNTIKDIIQ